jgi:hypothetical protein
MSETTTVALIALFGVVGAPAFLAYLTSRINQRGQREAAVIARAARKEDWARQDAVAAQAAEAARLLLERQDKTAAAAAETARRLVTANERVATTAAAAAAETNGRLGQIHELVNSSMTTQMEDAHTALVQQAIYMREVIRLNEEAGRKPDTAALAALAALEARVTELAAKLRDRAVATTVADAQRDTST